MSSTLTEISGVGPDTAKLLLEHGLRSPSEISGASIKRLCSIPGIGSIRAGRLIKAAKELLAGTNQDAKKATGASVAKAAARPRRTAQKAKPKSTIENKTTNPTKLEGVKEMSAKEQEKLKKAKKAAAKAAAKKAAAKKAAEKKAAAKKAKAKKAAAKKAAAKKAKAKKAAAKKAAAKKAKAKKAASKKPKKTKKAKAKKAKAKKSKSKKGKK